MLRIREFGMTRIGTAEVGAVFDNFRGRA